MLQYLEVFDWLKANDALSAIFRTVLYLLVQLPIHHGLMGAGLNTI